jgi:hypothetical protein
MGLAPLEVLMHMILWIIVAMAIARCAIYAVQAVRRGRA